MKCPYQELIEKYIDPKLEAARMDAEAKQPELRKAYMRIGEILLRPIGAEWTDPDTEMTHGTIITDGTTWERIKMAAHIYIEEKS